MQLNKWDENQSSLLTSIRLNQTPKLFIEEGWKQKGSG